MLWVTVVFSAHGTALKRLSVAVIHTLQMWWIKISLAMLPYSLKHPCVLTPYTHTHTRTCYQVITPDPESLKGIQVKSLIS